MTLTAFPAALLALALPGAALALPEVGDRLGTKADEVRSALEAAGGRVADFEVENGMVEVRCTDVASGAKWEICINPKTGFVERMKQGD